MSARAWLTVPLKQQARDAFNHLDAACSDEPPTRRWSRSFMLWGYYLTVLSEQKPKLMTVQAYVAAIPPNEPELS